MNLDMPEEIVAAAESRLSAAENDLKSTISGTRSMALDQLTQGIAGPIHTACTELIDTWSREVDSFTTILSEFKQSLLGTRSNVGDAAGSQAKSLSNIDVHAARLG